jgi:hypothetical protein
MGKFNKGVRKSQTLKPLGLPKRTTNGPAQFAVTRVGKQSKFGVKKAKAPGSTWQFPKKLGG